MRNFIIISVLLTFGLNLQSQTNNQAFVGWAKKEAVTINIAEQQKSNMDIEPLRELIGDASVVCLGESRHDIHEQYILKNRLVKYLIEELNFKTFILEASLPYSGIINNYIKKGEGNIDDIMASMPGWFLWDNEEMKELLVWMKNYNKDKTDDNKVQFFGIDIVAPVFGLNQVTKYLQNVDPEYSSIIKENDFAENDFDDNFWPNSMRTYASFTADRKRILKDNYINLIKSFEKNKVKYINKSSETEFDLMQRFAYCAQQANEMFSGEKRLDMGLIRDVAMADNILWILNKTNNKTIVWAHNVHIAKAEFEMTGESEPIKGMGNILAKTLGNKMISIGATFYKGEYTDWNRSFSPATLNSFEANLAETGHMNFLIDIRNNSKNSKVADVVNTKQTIRGQDFEMTTIPSHSFDALFFTKEITRVTPCEISLEKYRNMR